MGCLGSSKVISANEVKFLSESFKILLILSHNNYKISFANKFIVGKLIEKIPYIKLNHLEIEYPDLKFDVKTEQNKLQKAEIIIFQFPLMWFNIPSTIKKYIEDVFQYGVCPLKGRFVQGKKLIVSLTTGGPEEFYKEDKDKIENLIIGIKRTSEALGMKFLGVVYTCGVGNLSNIEDLEKRKGDLEKHVEKIEEMVKSC